MRFLALVAAAIALTVPTHAIRDRAAADPRPNIGVFYFPGWHAMELGNTKPPWQPIQAFPDREPLRGWYKGDDPDIVREQMQWMRDYGIDYVVFDWFFEKDVVHLDRPLAQYLAQTTPKPKFALLWANHGQHTTRANWDSMIAVWRDRYFARDDYYKIDGANVVYVNFAQRLADDAAAAGGDVKSWIADAQAAMRRAKLPPIYFVAGLMGATEPIIRQVRADGFSAISAYNMPAGPGDARAAHGYAERDGAYRRQWAALQERATGAALILPMTSGWDRTPWGGSPDPGRDKSMSTPDQFRDHLTAAKQFMAKGGVREGIICCWNEYGEGSFIEPTKSGGFKALQAVKDVFGTP